MDVTTIDPVWDPAIRLFLLFNTCAVNLEKRLFNSLISSSQKQVRKKLIEIAFRIRGGLFIVKVGFQILLREV